MIWEASIHEQFFNEAAAMRGELAGLANDGIACGDGWNNLAEWNGQRIIPGTDDANHAQRLVGELAGFRLGCKAVMRDAFRLEQTLGILCKIRCRVHRNENVGEQRFYARLA